MMSENWTKKNIKIIHSSKMSTIYKQIFEKKIVSCSLHFFPIFCFFVTFVCFFFFFGQSLSEIIPWILSEKIACMWGCHSHNKVVRMLVIKKNAEKGPSFGLVASMFLEKRVACQGKSWHLGYLFFNFELKLKNFQDFNSEKQNLNKLCSI